MTLLGCIAAIVPKEAAELDWILTPSAVAHEVNLHFDVRRDMYAIYDKSPQCLLLLDINIRTGRITMNHHNHRIFQLFDLPPEDLYFKDAYDYIDPPPRNQDFWRSIEEMENLDKEELALSVRGRTHFCVVSTTHRVKKNIATRSVMVQIESQAHATSAISEKISNNAVMGFESVIGQSPVMRSAIKRAKLLANTDSNIMIFGESGVGKDVFAQAIHNTSARRTKPFIAVNCGALPRDLIASELFGYEGGAFTGAKRQGNIGKFELANGGTIFLDELGELPLDLQATLLRVVEQKKLMRLGGSRLIDVDVKIISATNADLAAMIDQKRFRADLYYRLSTVTLTLPPLRERNGDVILLAEHFIRTVSKRIGRQELMLLSQGARELLASLPWNGNVRELQNLIESIVQLYDDPIMTPEHILDNLNNASGVWRDQRSLPLQPPARLDAQRFYVPSPQPAPQAPTAAPSAGVPAAAVPPARNGRNLLTQGEILAALSACGGNRSEAARYLGIARKTLYRNMERLGMPTSDKQQR